MFKRSLHTVIAERGASVAATMLLCLSFSASAQLSRYVVFFKDKQNTPYTLAKPEQWLSARAIDRRQRQQISLTTADLPVNPAYVDAVHAVGTTPLYTSRWMNAVLVIADAALVPQLQALPAVQRVEFVAPDKGLAGGRRKSFRQRSNSDSGPLTFGQRHQIGLDTMQALGFRGEGITVAIFDSGFAGADQAAAFAPLLQRGGVVDHYDFVHGHAGVFAEDSHGTEVLSVMAAQTNTGFVGGLPQANYLLYITEDVPTEYRVEEYNWLIAAERADSAGADVISASLGYNLFDDSSMDYTINQLDGQTAVITRAAAMAISKGMVVVVSAGNEGNNGWQRVTPPADGESVLAIGAVTSAGTRASFSSLGPTADNRIKPDVVAMGQNTAVVDVSGHVTTSSGTSFACPLVASLAGGIWQAFPQLTAQQVIDAIRQSGSLYFQPTAERGYGIPHFLAARHVLSHGQADSGIRVFPNPAAGALVQILLPQTDGNPVNVQVFGITGRLFMEANYDALWINNPMVLDTSALLPGLYLMRISTAQASQTLKLVKW